MTETKSWTDRALALAPHIVGAVMVVGLYIVTTRGATERVAEDFTAFRVEMRQALAEIRADTKPLPGMTERVAQAERRLSEQQAMLGALDGRLSLAERNGVANTTDLATIKEASKQRLR